MKYTYDVFLCHSLKDVAAVRDCAETLKAGGLSVWFEEWHIKSDEMATAAETTRTIANEGMEVLRARLVENGLENSRTCLLFISANTFGGEWPKLETYTLRFRDPSNLDRRFIPVRLSATNLIESLSQYAVLDLFGSQREGTNEKLIQSCRQRLQHSEQPVEPEYEWVERRALHLPTKDPILSMDFSADGSRAVSAGKDSAIKVWDTKSKESVHQFASDSGDVWSVALSADGNRIVSGGDRGCIDVWDVRTKEHRVMLGRHVGTVRCAAWNASNDRIVASGGNDNSVRIWDSETGECMRILDGHSEPVWSVAWSLDGRRIASGSADRTIRIWDTDNGTCIRVLRGHSNTVRCIVWSSDSKSLTSASWDNTVRLWDVDRSICLKVFEGHTGHVVSLALNSDDRHLLSGASDNTIRVWDLGTGNCLQILSGHTANIRRVTWKPSHRHALSGDLDGGIREWDLYDLIRRNHVATAESIPASREQIQYTNAKVLIVGESGAGKTGLSRVLAGEKWQPTDSTVGAWATQWKLPIAAMDQIEREIWLWDFGGQADQRLVHQLYMDETALAVLVFDGQKENVIETLAQWDRDLTRAAHKEFTKILVAARIDAGGLRISKSHIDDFVSARKYHKYIETSAKADIGCDDLKHAIVNSIQWDKIPWRSTPLLFKRLKEEIVRLKDQGRVILRFNELRDLLQLRIDAEAARFTDEELRAVTSLLAGPGVVWELKFGSWILLQPERINAYAQAVIQTIRADEHERGCISEERVLSGSLLYHSAASRVAADEERFILLAMHQTLVERGLCFREHTESGTLLIFPSFYRRERPNIVGARAVLVSYQFKGFVEEIYATLVVRLHHTRPFKQQNLWRYAADFVTMTGRQLGIRLSRRGEGAGELEVYFDHEIPEEEKIIFAQYVHEHLLKNAKDVLRLRHYICPHCHTHVGNREVAMRKLAEGKKDILCANCDDPEKRVPLWDKLEELFASPETKLRVRELEEQSKIVLDNESKERALVGEVISTVALAAQLSREFNVSDHGIDMEIEFKSDTGEATGRKLYLQLKSGDSYLRTNRDGNEIFTIRSERHVRYWMKQAFPVMLVIRDSRGDVRWMEVRDWLRRMQSAFKRPVGQITFEGERFDVMSVRRWRERVLAEVQVEKLLTVQLDEDKGAAIAT